MDKDFDEELFQSPISGSQTQEESRRKAGLIEVSIPYKRVTNLYCTSGNLQIAGVSIPYKRVTNQLGGGLPEGSEEVSIPYKRVTNWWFQLLPIKLFVSFNPL